MMLGDYLSHFQDRANKNIIPPNIEELMVGTSAAAIALDLCRLRFAILIID